ncbi:MAG: hypothetical protein COB30_012985 [Ectothiorhodospiraceae bacterium]|nr:hypothetical protein [Ectothiorhodospiraceae bacterium]
MIAGSREPEDSRHADNTLKWLSHLQPGAGEALQLAALAHDIDRAIEETTVKRADFDDYNAFKNTFKAAQARHGAIAPDFNRLRCGTEYYGRGLSSGNGPRGGRRCRSAQRYRQQLLFRRQPAALLPA